MSKFDNFKQAIRLGIARYEGEKRGRIHPKRAPDIVHLQALLDNPELKPLPFYQGVIQILMRLETKRQGFTRAPRQSRFYQIMNQIIDEFAEQLEEMVLHSAGAVAQEIDLQRFELLVTEVKLLKAQIQTLREENGDLKNQLWHHQKVNVPKHQPDLSQWMREEPDQQASLSQSPSTLGFGS